MTITECDLEPRPGGRAVLEYRDADGRYRAEGRVHLAAEPEHLVFDLSPRDQAGAVLFTGRYDLALTALGDRTRLRLGLDITNTTVKSVPYIAGIELGWGQVLDSLADAVGDFHDADTAAEPDRPKGKR